MEMNKYKEILDTSLYMKNQKEKIVYIKGILNDKDISFEEDDYGNIYSIRFPNKPIFSAHLDTVGELDVNMELEISNGRLLRPGFILGADDSAGLNLILNHVENINFALFKDEEIGCIGSNFAMRNVDFLDAINSCTFVIVLDRRNGGDVLGNTHGYCNEELDSLVLGVLDYAKSVSGVFCDLDSIQETLQGVNISVGYHNAHSDKEYLDLEEFYRINSKILDLNNIEIEPTFYKKQDIYFTGKYSTKYFSQNKSLLYSDYSYDVNNYSCDICGKTSSEYMSTFRDTILCSNCVELYCSLTVF